MKHPDQAPFAHGCGHLTPNVYDPRWLSERAEYEKRIAELEAQVLAGHEEYLCDVQFNANARGSWRRYWKGDAKATAAYDALLSAGRIEKHPTRKRWFRWLPQADASATEAT